MDSPIVKFYTAFSNLDIDGMLSCYSDDVVFEDPAFGTLKGERAKNMWRMLLESQKDADFKVIFSQVVNNESTGTATWEAFYTFSKTGRKVHNVIQAKMTFKGGKIIHHQDEFNLRAWAKQALGFKGALLGGTGFFKKSLQAQTNAMLDRFEKKGI